MAIAVRKLGYRDWKGTDLIVDWFEAIFLN